MTKRKIGIVAAVSLIVSVGTLHAGYEEFLVSLKNIGLDGAAVASSSRVSRNELASILNYVDCQDCHRPGSKLIDRLTSSRWNTFRVNPGVNFDDVTYSRSLEPANNYYCAAYVAEQGYMSGYPRQTSPLCSGKFCGENDTTVADFLQVLINILADRIASHYQADRKAMVARFDDTSNATLSRTYFSLQDAALLRRKSASCTTRKCALTDADELKVYLKYCTFNLEACGMTPQGTAEENFWPVAELNVLLSEGVITSDDANKLNVGAYVDGDLVIRTLSQVKEKVACTFNDDKDNDTIKDYADNCYLSANISQRDTDNDKVGDVCDDDIDGDAIKNPLNVIDEQGYINRSSIEKFTGTVDNCLLIPNANQKDADRDGQGDICQQGSIYGLAIIPKKIRNGSYTFFAHSTGTLTDFSWQFGDGSFGQGKTVTHNFPTPGIYQVLVTARGGNGLYTSAAYIEVSPAVEPTLGFSLVPRPLTATAPATISFIPVTTRPVSRIEWESMGQRKRGGYNEPISYSYPKAGTYVTIAKAYDDAQIVAYAQASVSLNNSFASYLQASSLSPQGGQQINFTTITAGIARKDIVAVKRDMGDGTLQTNTQLTHQYTYTKVGPKIVTQTISLLDGTTLINVLTLNVLISTNNTQDSNITLMPNKLTPRTGEPINFQFVLDGINWGEVSNIIVDMDDEHHLSFMNTKGSEGFNYIYTLPGVYHVAAQIQKNDKTWLQTQVTITVTGTPVCAKKNSATGGLCDTDKDTIADLCDDDIDGDGIKNNFGLIINQPVSCKYEITDLSSEYIDELIKNVTAGVALDNCPLTFNPDQKDGNTNAIGDICGLLIQQSEDLDADGISDDLDKCPTKAENINSIDDEDGCPEELTLIGSASQLQAVQCSLCPCPYVQPDSGLQPGDKVRAVLLNASGTIRLNTSNTYLITE